METTEIKFNDKKVNLILRDQVDISVMREIFKIREYKKVEDVIRNAKFPILDVGAHAGFFSIYASSLNSKIKIYALEIEKNNITTMKKNFENNEISNVEIIEAGLSCISGEQNLIVSDDSISHRISIMDEGIKIKAYSLKDLCGNYKIKKLSLLKMDIEGDEFNILNNINSEEFNLFDNIILEYHDTKNNHHKELETILRENKFGVQVFQSKFEKTMGFIFANKKA